MRPGALRRVLPRVLRRIIWGEKCQRGPAICILYLMENAVFTNILDALIWSQDLSPLYSLCGNWRCRISTHWGYNLSASTYQLSLPVLIQKVINNKVFHRKVSFVIRNIYSNINTTTALYADCRIGCAFIKFCLLLSNFQNHWYRCWRGLKLAIIVYKYHWKVLSKPQCSLWTYGSLIWAYEHEASSTPQQKRIITEKHRMNNLCKMPLLPLLLNNLCIVQHRHHHAVSVVTFRTPGVCPTRPTIALIRHIKSRKITGKYDKEHRQVSQS